MAQTRPFIPIHTTDEMHNTAMFSPVSKSSQPNPIQPMMKISQIMEVMIENAMRHFSPELFSSFISILLSLAAHNSSKAAAIVMFPAAIRWVMLPAMLLITLDEIGLPLLA